MSGDKYPKDLEISIDDLRESGWQKVVAAAGEYGYSSYWDFLSKDARNAIGSGKMSKGKVLWLLADACSMMLKPESINEPLQPFMVMQGRRSAIPEDFNDADLSFFEKILNEIDDFRLKARIADILWLRKIPRKVEHALCAIDSYRNFPLDAESLLNDGKDAWGRAIRLTLQLNKGADNRITEIRDVIFLNFQGTDSNGGFHALWLTELLDLSGLDEERTKDVAIKLEFLAVKAKDDRNYHVAKEYYEAAVKWNKKQNSEPDIYRLTADLAEAWVSEAEQRASGDNPSNMAAGLFLEKAIHLYRTIPGTARSSFNVNERILELHKNMNHTNKLVVSDMKVIETSSIDIGQIVVAAQKHVEGKPFPEVLLALANIFSGVDANRNRINAEESLRGSIHALFTSTHMTQDGRVAARSTGMDIGDVNSPNYQQAIWAERIKYYGIEIGLVVQGSILPALQVVNNEHRVAEGVLLSLCRNFGAVPAGREDLWAKGLYYGFELDFIISTHLLIPQLEHLVRIAMKEIGLKTTTLDSKGIETENGISTLLENPEIGKVLDDDLIFEFKALMAGPLYPNLRNEVAHGLAESASLRSYYAIYLWWYCLRLVINLVPWKKVEPAEENGEKLRSDI